MKNAPLDLEVGHYQNERHASPHVTYVGSGGLWSSCWQSLRGGTLSIEGIAMYVCDNPEMFPESVVDWAMDSLTGKIHHSEMPPHW